MNTQAQKSLKMKQVSSETQVSSQQQLRLKYRKQTGLTSFFKLVHKLQMKCNIMKQPLYENLKLPAAKGQEKQARIT